MSYFESGGGGSVGNLDTYVITKDNNPLTFKKGRYRAFTVTTDPNIAIVKKMIYTNHQCSNTKAGLTYETNEESLNNEIIVNNKVVSSVKDSYHTTPYYHFMCKNSKGYSVTDLGKSGGGYCNHRYRSVCNECGATKDYGAIGHDWERADEADKQSQYAREAAQRGDGISHLYGYTYDSTHWSIDTTYYERTSVPTSANQVNEMMINGKMVSTTKGGCYTTPYYKYTYTVKSTKSYVATDTRPSYNPSSGAWNMVRFYYASEDDYKKHNYYKADTLYGCGEYDQYPSGRYTYNTYTVNSSATGYGESVPSGATINNTYYLKTCGYSNGQTIKATIVY